jgi:Glucose dehydrogenase
MKSLFFILLSITLLSACSPETVKKETIPIGDWRHHGGNHSSDKYAPLDQIKGSNFSQLEVVWRYRSPDLDLPEDLAYPTGDYRAVPLIVNGIMYVNSNHGLISALDSTTGEELWVLDPKSYELGPPCFLPYKPVVLNTGQMVR